jgi:hypothetical protein
MASDANAFEAFFILCNMGVISKGNGPKWGWMISS